MNVESSFTVDSRSRALMQKIFNRMTRSESKHAGCMIGKAVLPPRVRVHFDLLRETHFV